MFKTLLSLAISLLTCSLFSIHAQDCQINGIIVTPQACNDNYFMAQIDLDYSDPSSPGFTLAGNGLIYGTYLYDELPILVGPLLGDPAAIYEFIAWDVTNADCQQFVSFESPDCGPLCSISNAALDLIQCISPISAQVDLTLDYGPGNGAAYDVFNENGSHLASGLYTNQPLTFPAFVVNGADSIILTICDQATDGCCETFTLAPIDCNVNNCEIYNVSADPQCTSGSHFLLHLDFEYVNVASDSFTVTGNSLNYGTFGYTELPVTLGPLNGVSGIEWEFLIADKGMPSCQTLEILGNYTCPPPCHLSAAMADVFECTSDTSYAFAFELEIEGEGDLGYALFNETTYLGTYAYDDIPQILEDIQGSGDYVDQITVCDNENPGCCTTILYEAFLCAGCVIEDLTATALPCNDEGLYMVEINFYHFNEGASGFEVTGNGNNYGTFEYEDLPILVGPFVGDGSQHLEFVVTDNDNALCFDAIELGVFTCEDICEISALEVETGECTGDGTYVLHVNFEYQGVTGVGFDLYANGEQFDFYSYDDLPLVIEHFPASGTGTDWIQICENDNDECCATIEFDSPGCECSIFDATAEILGCTSDSTFGISLEFFSENNPGNNVDIFIDGVFWGFYNSENQPIMIDDVQEGTGNAVITICANDNNDCCTELVLELIECENAECNVWDLFVETGDCSSDSTYLLDFTFEHFNLPNDSVTVTANGEFIGQYLIQPTFNRIEHFPVLNQQEVQLIVCAAGNENCCDTIVYVAPDCSTFGQCDITEFEAFNVECMTDSTYLLLVEFEYQNFPSDSVIISANGNNLGTYHLHEGSILIEHVLTYESDQTILTICAVGDSECCATIEFETPDCEGSQECLLVDLVADPGDCTSDSTYNLFIHYFANNLPTDSVVVTSGGETIGTYAHNPEGFTIEHFPAAITNGTLIEVCAVGAPDCCDVFDFETPNCGQGLPCEIWDLVALPGECMSDSTYLMHFEFNFNNLPVDSVHVTANGHDFGNYQVHEGSIWIEHFPEFDENHTILTICAVGAPDCCATVEYETPHCDINTECHIADLVADPGDCLSDSSYNLFIHYIAQNLPGDSVIVTANNEYIGTFLHQPDGFVIPNFPAFGTPVTHILVCAQGAPDCCDDRNFVTQDCGQEFECGIWDLNADTGDCSSDSTYLLHLSFNYVSLPGDSVHLTANEQSLGNFHVSEGSITIEHFPVFDENHTVVTLCAVGDEECCDVVEFETVHCGEEPCHIFDLTYTMTDCDSNGQFYFILDFEFSNVGPEGFSVHGNGNQYGVFGYDNVPLQLGPFIDSIDIWEFAVTDLIFQDCHDAVDVGDVECTVSSDEVLKETVYDIVNNGQIPVLTAKQPLTLSIHTISGSLSVEPFNMAGGQRYDLGRLPDGFYIGMIEYGRHRWPVKLIRLSR